MCYIYLLSKSNSDQICVFNVFCGKEKSRTVCEIRVFIP